MRLLPLLSLFLMFIAVGCGTGQKKSEMVSQEAPKACCQKNMEKKACCQEMKSCAKKDHSKCKDGSCAKKEKAACTDSSCAKKDPAACKDGSCAKKDHAGCKDGSCAKKKSKT